MQDNLKDLLDRRTKRAIAVILGVKEREIDASLTAAQSAKLRKVVLDQLNEYRDLVVDILESLDQGGAVLNDLYLQRLDEIHAAVVKPAKTPAAAGAGNGHG